MGHDSGGHNTHGYSDDCNACASDIRADCGESNWHEQDESRRSCFPYSSLIEVPYGKIPIGELTKGQMILSYDQGVLTPRMITRFRVRGLARIFEVEFESGNKLRTTSHHTFLTGRGWQQLKNIRPGDVIIQASSHEKVVKDIYFSGKIEPVFNIYTEYEHNFIVEGCVAHNFTEFRAIRTVLHRLFLDSFSKVSTKELITQS